MFINDEGEPEIVTEGEEKIEANPEEGIGFDFPLDRDPAKPAPEKKEDAPSSEEEAPAEEPKEEAKEEAEAEPEAEEGQEFKTEKEKGLYRDLKKEREARKEIEAERDYFKLQAKYGPKPTETPEKEEQTEEVDPLDAMFEGRADDDFLTVGEVKKVEAARKEREARLKQREAEQAKENQGKVSKIRQELDTAEEKLRTNQEYPDYDGVRNAGQEVMAKFRGLQIEFMHILNTKGAEEAVKYVYKLGKDMGKPAAPNAQAQVKKAIANAEKQKTSANAGPGNKPAEKWNVADLEAMDLDELVNTLANMSVQQIKKVPKHIREKALKA